MVTFPAPHVQRLIGYHESSALGGDTLTANLRHAAGLAPTLGEAIVDQGFGVSLAGSAIDYREWAMLSLASLIALGDTGDQLEIYLDAAVRHGASHAEILDVLSHAALYAGAPRAINAMRRITGYLERDDDEDLPGVTERVVCLSDHDTIVWDNEADGPAIVLLHALNFDHRFWRGVYRALSTRGRVVSYDLPGHGRGRGAPVTDLDGLAESTVELFDALGIDVADVYGASYGGAIAQHVALNHPERVRSLALIATFGDSPHGLLAARADHAERDGMEAQVSESIIRWFLPETIAANPGYVRYARTLLRRALVSDWAAAWRAMADLKTLDWLPTLDMPVHVVAGRDDRSTHPEDMKLIADAVPGSTYTVLEPGTHMMPLEQPEALASELTAFRDRVDAIRVEPVNE